MPKSYEALEFNVNVVGSSVFGRYPKVSAEKTYNMFESDGWLLNMAGYQKMLQPLENAEGRGVFFSIRGNFAIAVINANVYRINPGLGYSLIGTIETTSGPVFMDENLNNQICIVDGSSAYIYNWSQPPDVVKQTETHFTDGTFLPNYVCFHATYFLFGNGIRTGNGSRWFIYKPHPSDPFMLAFLFTEQLQIKPDFAIAVERIPAQASNVLVFGRSVCEIHSVINNSTELYRRNSSVSIDYGCISVDTIASNEEFMMWVGTNASSKPVLMLFSGQQAKRISTDGIDYVLGTIQHPEKSTAMFYRQDGRLFYQVTFFDEEDNLTLLYDVIADKFYHGSDHNLDFHPARDVIYFDGDNYFISLSNGAIYLWSSDITQIIEDIPDTSIPAAPLDPRLVFDMQCIRICQTIRAPKSTPFIVTDFIITVDMGNDQTPGIQECIIYLISETGIRLFSEIPSGYLQLVPENGGMEDCAETPYMGRIDLAMSKDGGETYSSYVPRYTNVLAYRKNILKWEQMGLCNEWTPKLRFWISGRKVAAGGIVSLIPATGIQ
jgi:hypothetical protein